MSRQSASLGKAGLSMAQLRRRDHLRLRASRARRSDGHGAPRDGWAPGTKSPGLEGVDSPHADLFPANQRADAPGRGRAGRQPAGGASLRARPDRREVRLRRRLLRRLHGARRQPGHARLRHAPRRDRRCRHHDDRGARAGRPPASGAGSLSRGRGLPVRLLHAGDGDGSGRPASRQSRADRSGHREGARPQRLPLRHLPAHRSRDQTGGGEAEEREGAAADLVRR